MGFFAPYILLLLQAFTQPVADTVAYPQNYFRPPLDIPLLLAGNFGEPRSDHFHTGLDLQTQQVEGLPVHAAADGYVSRINVSPVGYGNSLFITHPNGYTTVYGHLKEFTPQLMKRLRKEQYAKKSFAVDIELKPGEFPVKQGDKIALSGNTGSSGGPHLHFEIRDAKERPINPLLFGFKIADSIAPKVGYLRFYPMDKLKYKCDSYQCKLSCKGDEYRLKGDTIKLNSTSVGVSVSTYDLMDKVENTLGIYTLKMWDNGKQLYGYKIDRISFTDVRYVLGQIDYPAYLKERRFYNKCFVEPGNKCPVYSDLVNRGIIDLSDGAVHTIKIEAGDFFGNVSTVQFSLQYDAQSILFIEKNAPYVKRFDYGRPNEFSNDDIKISLPANCLFDTLYFNYTATPASGADVYSKEQLLDNPYTGLFTWYNISVRAENLDPRYDDKAIIVFRDEKGKEFSRGGSFADGFVSTRAREFGLCYIKIDTIPPRIVPLNIAPGKNMSKSYTIRFKITDELSGIGSYNTYLDGNWVVADYDAKTSTLTYRLGQDIRPGEHHIKLVVEDERHNTSHYSVKFSM